MNKISWEEAVAKIKSDETFKKLVIDSFFDDPVTSAAERFYYGGEWSAARELIAGFFPQNYEPHKMKAIDIGAGRGIASYALARDGWNVTALEPCGSVSVGNRAIQKIIDGFNIKNISISDDYGESLKFADGAFDLVYMRQALHHAAALDKFCSEAARVLKSGGVFIAAREHVLTRKSDLQAFLDAHPLHKYYGGENAYTLEEYRIALEKAGIGRIRVLKTYDSDINLFPDSLESLKKRLGAKIGFNPPAFISGAAMLVLNFLNSAPGRLYTFAGVKL